MYTRPFRPFLFFPSARCRTPWTISRPAFCARDLPGPALPPSGKEALPPAASRPPRSSTRRWRTVTEWHRAHRAGPGMAGAPAGGGGGFNALDFWQISIDALGRTCVGAGRRKSAGGGRPPPPPRPKRALASGGLTRGTPAPLPARHSYFYNTATQEIRYKDAEAAAGPPKAAAGPSKAPEPEAAPPSPGVWEQGFDDEHNKFFIFNRTTNETFWGRLEGTPPDLPVTRSPSPTKASPATTRSSSPPSRPKSPRKASAPAAGGVEEGQWLEAYTPNAQRYYVNLATGHMAWAPPVARGMILTLATPDEEPELVIG